jgi:pyruvate formate lyase activating enzyme
MKTVRTSTSLRVGGLSPLSSVDWPGELAATVFLAGCPWRCRYCHNADLREAGGGASGGASGTGDIAWDEVLAFLRTRVGLLDAVVFSGGEPTAQAGLAQGARDVRALGLRVGLHTGGAVRSRLVETLPHADWVGFDVKAPFSEYERLTGVPGSGKAAREGLAEVIASGVTFEARTTVHPALLGADALLRMADELIALGVREWVLQPFRPQGCVDGDLVARPISPLGVPHALAGHGLAVSVRA